MKKLLLTAAVAVLGITSCTINEVTKDRYENNAIEFSTYIGASATKGLVLDDEAVANEKHGIKTTGFGVTAFYTGQDAWPLSTAKAPDFMYNQEVKWDAALTTPAWTYSPIKYWPTATDDKVSFFAYAPYSDQTQSTKPYGITLPKNDANSATTTLNFAVDTASENMVDFVAAVAIDKEQTTDYSHQEPVNFAFKHELSRLKFQAKLDENLAEADKTNIVLTKIELAVADEFYSEADYTFSNENGKVGTWSDYTKAASAYDIDGVLDFAAPTGVNLLGKDYGNTKVKCLTTATAVDLFTADEYLFMIPSDSETGIEDNKFKVTIYYDILTQDGNLSEGYSCTSAIKTVSLPNGILQQGTAYNVIFTIYIDRIEVSASVEPWQELTPGEIPVPQQ